MMNSLYKGYQRVFFFNMSIRQKGLSNEQKFFKNNLKYVAIINVELVK